MDWLIPKYELENFKKAQNTLTYKWHVEQLFWITTSKIKPQLLLVMQIENVVSGLQRA